MLGCGNFLGGEFVVQQVVELLWARPLVVLYNMSVAGVRVVEFGTWSINRGQWQIQLCVGVFVQRTAVECWMRDITVQFTHLAIRHLVIGRMSTAVGWSRLDRFWAISLLAVVSTKSTANFNCLLMKTVGQKSNHFSFRPWRRIRFSCRSRLSDSFTIIFYTFLSSANILMRHFRLLGMFLTCSKKAKAPTQSTTIPVDCWSLPSHCYSRLISLWTETIPSVISWRQFLKKPFYEELCRRPYDVF